MADSDYAYLIQEIHRVNPKAFPASRDEPKTSKAPKSQSLFTPSAPTTSFRRYNRRLASEVKHARRRNTYTPKRKQSSPRVQSLQVKTPTKDATEEDSVKAEKLATIQSLQEKVLLLEDEGQRSKIQEFIDGLREKEPDPLPKPEAQASKLPTISLAVDGIQEIKIPGGTYTHEQWLDEQLHDPSLINLRIAFDERLDGNQMGRLYTVQFQGLQPGETTVRLRYKMPQFPSHDSDPLWERAVVVTPKIPDEKEAPPQTQTALSLPTTMPKDILSLVESLKPVLLRAESDTNDPRWEMLLNRLMLCIMETRDLQQRIGDGKSVLRSLDQQEGDFKRALKKLDTSSGDSSQALTLARLTSDDPTTPDIVGVADDMHKALAAVAGALTSPSEVAAETRRKQKLNHLLRSAHKKFDHFDKDQDGTIDMYELVDVMQWLWSSLDVHGEQIPDMTQEQMVKKVMQGSDADKIGVITYEEFEVIFLRAAKLIGDLHKQLHTEHNQNAKKKHHLDAPVVHQRIRLVKEMVEGACRVFSIMDTQSRQDVKNEELKHQRLRGLNRRLTLLLNSARRMVQLVADVITRPVDREWCAHVDTLIVASRTPQSLFMVLSMPQPGDESAGGAPSPRAREAATQRKKINSGLRASQNEMSQAAKTVRQLEVEMKRTEAEAMEIMHTLTQLHSRDGDQPLLMWGPSDPLEETQPPEAGAAANGAQEGGEAGEGTDQPPATPADAVDGLEVDKKCEDLKKWMDNLGSQGSEY